MGEEGLISTTKEVFRSEEIMGTTDTDNIMSVTLSGLLERLTSVAADNITSNQVSEMTTISSTYEITPSLEEELTECAYDYLPSVWEYHHGLDPLGLSFALTLSILATILVITFYVDTLRHVFSRLPSSYQTNTVMVLTLYPVVSVVATAATIVPRAQFIMETIAHEMFMVTLYHMFCLTLAYAGGEAGFVATLTPDPIDPKVGPCCCWPCCFFLPSMMPTKKRLKYLRALVLQAAIVQGVIYTTFLIISSEDQDLFHTVYNYMTAIVVCSVLSSIWGLVMTLKAAFEPMKNFFIKEKFIVFQLVLVLTKFQMFGARLLAQTNVFPCNDTISPTLYTNLIYNVFVSWEMVLLCFLARMLYKRPLKISDSMGSLASNLPSKISTIQDKIPPSEIIRDNNNSTIVVRF